MDVQRSLKKRLVTLRSHIPISLIEDGQAALKRNRRVADPPKGSPAELKP
jgi:hypothetical protein